MCRCHRTQWWDTRKSETANSMRCFNFRANLFSFSYGFDKDVELETRPLVILLCNGINKLSSASGQCWRHRTQLIYHQQIHSDSTHTVQSQVQKRCTHLPCHSRKIRITFGKMFDATNDRLLSKRTKRNRNGNVHIAEMSFFRLFIIQLMTLANVLMTTANTPIGQSQLRDKLLFTTISLHILFWICFSSIASFILPAMMPYAWMTFIWFL